MLEFRKHLKSKSLATKLRLFVKCTYQKSFAKKKISKRHITTAITATVAAILLPLFLHPLHRPFHRQLHRLRPEEVYWEVGLLPPNLHHHHHYRLLHHRLMQSAHLVHSELGELLSLRQNQQHQQAPQQHQQHQKQLQLRHRTAKEVKKAPSGYGSLQNAVQSISNWQDHPWWSWKLSMSAWTKMKTRKK